MNWVDPATAVPNKTPMVWVFTKHLKSHYPKAPAAGHFWRDYFYDLVSGSGERAKFNTEGSMSCLGGDHELLQHDRVERPSDFGYVSK